MSEAELHILKSRLQGGILNKARRGELEMPLPIGLVYTADARVVLDPDRQIQDTVRLLFDTFRETGSACAVVRRLRGQKILFPRRIRRGIGKGDVLWSLIDHSRVLQILHNPRYAGAFAYGRTRTAYNAKLKPVQLRVREVRLAGADPRRSRGLHLLGRVRAQPGNARAERERLLAGPARSDAAPGQCAAAGAGAVRPLRGAHAGPLRAVRAAGCARTTPATRPSCATPASTASGSAALPVDEAVGASAAADGGAGGDRGGAGGAAGDRAARGAGRGAARGAAAARPLRGRAGAPAIPEGRSGQPAGGRRPGGRLECAAARPRRPAARARAPARGRPHPAGRAGAPAHQGAGRRLPPHLERRPHQRGRAQAHARPAHRGRDPARRRPGRHPCALARRTHAEPGGGAAAADVARSARRRRRSWR